MVGGVGGAGGTFSDSLIFQSYCRLSQFPKGNIYDAQQAFCNLRHPNNIVKPQCSCQQEKKSPSWLNSFLIYQPTHNGKFGSVLLDQYPQRQLSEKKQI